jgi:hypothetical protein
LNIDGSRDVHLIKHFGKYLREIFEVFTSVKGKAKSHRKGYIYEELGKLSIGTNSCCLNKKNKYYASTACDAV